MSNAILTVHCGGKHRSRAELEALATPEATASWKPVPHHELVRELAAGLERHQIRIAREQYATMGRDDARLFGTMDLEVPTFAAPDYRLALGLRASNDKSMAIQVIAAARVFVCDNMCFSGSGGSVVLGRKHTSGLDLGREVPRAVDSFLEKADAFRLDLEAMKGVGLVDSTAKALIHDAFAARNPVLPVRLFPQVSRLYFADEAQREKFPDRTFWSLTNSFTEAVKALRPGSQHRHGHLIGRHFGRELRRFVPEPALAGVDADRN